MVLQLFFHLKLLIFIIYSVVQHLSYFYRLCSFLHLLYILAGHLAHSCIFVSPFQLGRKMVRRWVTSRKSIAGPGPIVRFEMPVEVEVSC